MTPTPTAIAPIDSVTKTPLRSFSTPEAEHLAQKFEAMMKAPPPPGEIEASFQPSDAAKSIGAHESRLTQTFEDINEFTTQAAGMSIQEATAVGTKLSSELALANFSLNSATAVASGSHKSLQTLLKNQ